MLAKKPKLILCLMETVAKSLAEANFHISERRYYTDSTISLSRIKGVDHEYQQWVQNRTKTIREKSKIEDWFYVLTKQNPSDLPSRGCLLSDLQSCDMWKFGPNFIRESNIPMFPYQNLCDETEIKKNSCLLSVDFAATAVENLGLLPKDYFTTMKNEPKLSDIIEITKFSDLNKLLRVTAYVLRFTSKDNTVENSVEILEEELKRARMMWIASEQRQFALREREKFVKLANGLCFFSEDGLIRCKGRLKFADLPYNTKFPLFVPTDSYLSELLISEAHDKVFHQKVSPTLVQLRSEYWVPKSRCLVTKVVSKCALCNIYDAVPYKQTPLPDLPRFRVEVVPPFQNIGTDHAGPLFVRNIYSNSKKMYKCYIAIFSCCVTRMIHLQLQPDLEAPSTIRGMKRTFARVGTPNLMIFDNHKTYQSKKVKNFTKLNGIVCRPILELSPNWGGFYERMNSIIKRALRKTLGNAHLNYEELETILVEIEGIMNSRPLSSYFNDSEILEPLTPSHLMYGRRLMSNMPSNMPRSDNNISPSKRVRYLNRLLNTYWRRFTTEYLTSLRERNCKEGKFPIVQIGQVVLIKKKLMPRNMWSIGKIERVICSQDGVPKGAEILTKNGIVKRPLTLLCPVEMCTSSAGTES